MEAPIGTPRGIREIERPRMDEDLSRRLLGDPPGESAWRAYLTTRPAALIAYHVPPNCDTPT